MNISQLSSFFPKILNRIGFFKAFKRSYLFLFPLTGIIYLLIITKVYAFSSPQWVVIDGVSNPREKEVVTQWITEVQTILSSSEFENNLQSLETSYPSVYIRDQMVGKVSDVVDIITLRDPNLRAVKTPMALVGGVETDYAFGGWTGDPFNEGDNSTSLTLGRTHLKRYFSQNQVEKSCAINTLAHEFSHLISTDPKLMIHALTDTGIHASSRPVNAIGSYLIGTTAQCTWLEKEGRIDSNHFTECVGIFGTLNFNSLRCDKFKNSEPLQNRSDLPSPAKPLL